MVGENRPPEPPDALLERMVRLLVHDLPAGWVECVVTYRALGSYSEMPGRIRLISGAGLPRPYTPPQPLAELFERLRRTANRPGEAPWATATLELSHPAAYEITYDKAHPDWTAEPPVEAHEEERRRFPREAPGTP